MFFWGCRQEGSLGTIEVNYESNKAVSVQLDYSGNPHALGIYLKGELETAVFGKFKKTNGKLLFSPVVPFTPGQVYEVRDAGQKLNDFKILSVQPSTLPEIIGFFPAQDTIPENLLKIYVQFSQPMQNVGSALDYIRVFNETDKKKENIFLHLETELWNRAHDRLTLWLDPGRIKTDLIPNRELGLPIKKGNAYTIKFDKKWKTAAGQELNKEYRKQWVVTTRDATKPDLKRWKVDAPNSNSAKALVIHFDEPLDYMLAQESMNIRSSNGKLILGDWKLNKWATTIRFTPSSNWKKGNYEILVNPKLEDFAGNTLNRMFDENLKNATIAASTQKNPRISFTIVEK